MNFEKCSDTVCVKESNNIDIFAFLIFCRYSCVSHFFPYSCKISYGYCLYANVCVYVDVGSCYDQLYFHFISVYANNKFSVLSMDFSNQDNLNGFIFIVPFFSILFHFIYCCMMTYSLWFLIQHKIHRCHDQVTFNVFQNGQTIKICNDTMLKTYSNRMLFCAFCCCCILVGFVYILLYWMNV